MNAGNSFGLKSRMSCGKLTSKVLFRCRARSTGSWYASMIIAAFSVVAEQFDHDPTTEDVTDLLERQNRKTKQMLSDHGKQFKEDYKKWCKGHGVEPIYAHPSYPQDNGKVEQCIQKLNREFINALRKFPGWLKGNLADYRDWFTHSRRKLINNGSISRELRTRENSIS